MLALRHRAQLGAVLCALLGCHESPFGSQRPRNAILISIDTLRADHLGCYGSERDTSPAIDRLAAQGVRFSDVSSSAPWTLPAHASLFTGLYARHHGVKSHLTQLPEHTLTLAEVCRASGFQTFGVVNTWMLYNPQLQFGQGFDDYRHVSEMKENPATHEQEIVGGGEEITALARELLTGRDPEKPFFLFLHFYDVHGDYTPAPEYRRRFVEPYPGPLTGHLRQLSSLSKQGGRLSEADERFLREMYDAEIRQLDDVLGRFFGWLGEQGLDRETAIVLTADHGEEFGDHGGMLHGRTQYQELLGIPLILRGPGIPGGVSVDSPVSLVDVAPTLLSLLGLDPPADVDGLDASLAWRSPAAFPVDRPLYSEADQNNRIDGKPVVDIKAMIRAGTDKLHLDRHSQETELYDLSSDRHEQRDLARTSPDRVRELRGELERFLESGVRSEVIPPSSERVLEILENLGYAGGTETPLPAKRDSH